MWKYWTGCKGLGELREVLWDLAVFGCGRAGLGIIICKHGAGVLENRVSDRVIKVFLGDRSIRQKLQVSSG